MFVPTFYSLTLAILSLLLTTLAPWRANAVIIKVGDGYILCSDIGDYCYGWTLTSNHILEATCDSMNFIGQNKTSIDLNELITFDPTTHELSYTKTGGFLTYCKESIVLMLQKNENFPTPVLIGTCVVDSETFNPTFILDGAITYKPEDGKLSRN